MAAQLVAPRAVLSSTELVIRNRVKSRLLFVGHVWGGFYLIGLLFGWSY
jgi:hypothetical protein